MLPGEKNLASAKNSFSGIYKSSFAFRPAIVAASGDVMEVQGGVVMCPGKPPGSSGVRELYRDVEKVWRNDTGV